MHLVRMLRIKFEILNSSVLRGVSNIRATEEL